MTVYHREAANAQEVAKLLRARGRTIITGPARCGKTTELLRYAEDRYPNGRFAVVAQEERHAYITELHKRIHNGFSLADVVAARLLGEKLKYEDVPAPYFINPISVWSPTFGQSTPVFVDRWNTLTEAQQKEIIKRRLFIAAIASTGEDNASSQEDQDR